MNIYNIILFHELSSDSIEKDNNKTHLDVIKNEFVEIQRIFSKT